MSCQNGDISKLKKKLEKYNEIAAERDELRDLCQEIELWKKRFENGHKRVLNELETTCEVQMDKIKKFMDAEYEWDLQLRNLQNSNDCISNEIKNLRLSENNFQSELADSKQIIQQLMIDLSCAKSQLDERNIETEQLKEKLKSNEDKLWDVLRLLEYRTKECNQSKEDFECIKIKLAEVKECAARMEENLTLERETLHNELKNRDKILNEMEVQYDKMKCEISGEKYKVKRLTEDLEKAYKEKGYDQIELKNEIVMLKKENCSKDDDIHNMKKEIENLQQKNRCEVMEISSQKLQLEEMKCQLNLKPMTLLSEGLEFENKTPISGNNLKSKTNIDEYTPNTSMANTINGKTELNNLTCELENLKRDLGIDFTTQK